MTTSTAYSVSVQTRGDDRAPILVAARLLDAPTAEIGLDPAAAARLAADLCNAVYQSVYVAAGTQDSDDAGSVCNGYWGALEAAKTLEDKR